MVESRPYVPSAQREPIEILRVPNSIIFPLQHLENCLQQLEEGAVFSGEPLWYFRDSNRKCRTINISIAISESVLGTMLSRGKPDGFRGRLVKAGGLLMLAHAAVQAKRGWDKSQRQFKLDSKDSISKHDL